MRRSAATMRLLLVAICALGGLPPGQARPQTPGHAGNRPMQSPTQLSGAAANSMAPLTSEWRDQSVRRLSGPEEVSLSQSPYAWKPLLSERRSSRESKDGVQSEQPVTAISAQSSSSSPSAPTAPTGTSPIGESLKEVASQLMESTVDPGSPTSAVHSPHPGTVQAVPRPPEIALPDVRTPPIVKAGHVKPITKPQDIRKSDVPKPVMVSATVSTLPDDDEHVGFQGVAEPVALPEEVHDRIEPKKPNSTASVSTTAEPQPSTTSSDRISTWILLSGTHGAVTTPSSLKKNPPPVPPKDTPSKTAALSPPVHKPAPVRPNPAVRKPIPTPRPPAQKKPILSTTTMTISTTQKPSYTTGPSSNEASHEYVKISEAVVSTPQKTKPTPAPVDLNKKVVKPINNTDSIIVASRPPQNKTKVSSATVPFSPAIAFRRKPIQGAPIPAIPPAKNNKTPKPTPKPVQKTSVASTSAKPTTVTPVTEELTTLPEVSEIVTTEDSGLVPTTVQPITTSKPKRTSTSTKKKKKKKKNKNRRRRPSKKTAVSATGSPESKIGAEGNITKVGQNGISTKIYNYLAREVMPSVSVGIIGLVVTAGLAGLFLYPFGGGTIARRTYDEAMPGQHAPNDHMYYYDNYADPVMDGAAGKPEEEVLGQVFSGMQKPETRYAGAPAIYGGGDSGPPDAQYSDSYSRYDSNGQGTAGYRRPTTNSDDLRQGTGYSSVSVNGQGQVTGYVDPAPLTSVGKFDVAGSDALQRTRYDVDTTADQVDLTYSGASSQNKKTEESPFVVGSVTDPLQNNRYRIENSPANVDITYGVDASHSESNHAKEEPVHSASYSADSADLTKPASRYSVRVNGGSGQVALGYGSHQVDTQTEASMDASAGSVKLDQTGAMDLTYGAGLDSENRYTTANGAQPRAMEANPRSLDKKKSEIKRRRRDVPEDDAQLNEIDAPILPADKNDFKVDNRPVLTTKSTQQIEMTTDPQEDTTTIEPVTTVLFGEEINKNPADDLRSPVVAVMYDKTAGIVSSSTSTSTSTTTRSPTVIASGNKTNKTSNGNVMIDAGLLGTANITSDPITSLMNVFRKVAEFKLRVGLNLLRGTSEAVTRYIGGVTRRMEEAVEKLSNSRSKRNDNNIRRRRTRATSGERLKHQLKKLAKKHSKKDQ